MWCQSPNCLYTGLDWQSDGTSSGIYVQGESTVTTHILLLLIEAAKLLGIQGLTEPEVGKAHKNITNVGAMKSEEIYNKVEEYDHSTPRELVINESDNNTFMDDEDKKPDSSNNNVS